MHVVQYLTFIKMETVWKWLLPKEYGTHVSVLLTSCQNNVLRHSPVHSLLLTFGQTLLCECKEYETSTQPPVLLILDFHKAHLEFSSTLQSTVSITRGFA